MKTLKYYNANKAIDIEYLTDLIDGNEELTIYQATQIVDGVRQVGINGTAETFGMIDVVDEFTLTEMKTLATDKNLTLEVYEDGEDTVELNALTALDITTSSIDAGISGVAQLEVVTFPATTGATQADYVLMYNALTGESAAIWLDIDGAGTAPTGALYTAADYKITVGIATGESAAQVAAKAVIAIEASAWEDEITLTDNADGTVDFQQDYSGDIADAAPKNADDSGVGSITSSTSNDGTDGVAYEFTFVAEGGNTPYIWTTESTLPEGITLSTSGILSGTPRETGTFTLTILLTDQFGITDTLVDEDFVVTAS